MYVRNTKQNKSVECIRPPIHSENSKPIYMQVGKIICGEAIHA